MWSCHAPQGVPTLLKKNLKMFIGHNLLDAEGILKKYLTLIFAKKMGVALKRPSVWPKFFGISFLIFVVYYKLQGILISN